MEFLNSNHFLSLFLQAKADDIEKLMNENEHLKAVIEDLRVNMVLITFPYWILWDACYLICVVARTYL